MRRLVCPIALTFFLTVSAAHPAEVSCLDYGGPSQSAQARSEKNTDKAPSSNAKPNKIPQFEGPALGGWRP
jgi:hypothetical protein